MKKIEGKQGHVLQTDVRVNVILYLFFHGGIICLSLFVCMAGWFRPLN